MGEREYGPDVMQLLYVANRYEFRQAMADSRARGAILLCDRYLASSVAYGEAQGLDPEWLQTIQRHLPQPDVTILLDIPPEVSARRKQLGRDRYEQDLALLGRVRASYRRQAAAGWVTIDATRDRDAVARGVTASRAAREPGGMTSFTGRRRCKALSTSSAVGCPGGSDFAGVVVDLPPWTLVGGAASFRPAGGASAPAIATAMQGTIAGSKVVMVPSLLHVKLLGQLFGAGYGQLATVILADVGRGAPVDPPLALEQRHGCIGQFVRRVDHDLIR